METFRAQDGKGKWYANYYIIDHDASYFKLLETSTAARTNTPELSFKFPRKSHANSKQRITVRLNLLKDASECYEFMLFFEIICPNFGPLS